MEKTLIFMFPFCLLILSCCAAHSPPISSPISSPAPAPAPAYVNLRKLLTVAGPFHIFLNYLESTKVIETFQNQANNTEEGVTIFVPQDSAFSSLKKSTLSNLTQDQLRSLCLFHGLSHFYSFSDFKNLSQLGPVATFSGGQYSLNFTDISGTIHLSSGWTNTKITSSVLATDPVAVYEISKVLLPEAIFGTDIPPTPAPAPAPAPERESAADSPAELTKSGKSPSSSLSSSSYRVIGLSAWIYFVLAISGGIVLIL